nr:LHFPL tetraspan subfamily member 6 protein isoform X1 [Zonotrichia albicollis]
MLDQQLACRDRHSSYHTHTIRRLAHIFPCKDCSLLPFLPILLLRCLSPLWSPALSSSPCPASPPLAPRTERPSPATPQRSPSSRDQPGPGTTAPASDPRIPRGSAGRAREAGPTPQRPRGPGPPPRPVRARGRAPALPFAAAAAAARPLAPGPGRGPATAPSAAGPARGGGGGEGGGEAAESAASRGTERGERGTRGGKDGPGWGGSRSRSRPPGAPASRPRRDRGRVARGGHRPPAPRPCAPGSRGGSLHARRVWTFDFMMGGNIPLALRIRASPSVRICQG